MRRANSASVEASLPVVEYSRCPAKTYLSPEGRIRSGRDVFTHCQIVGQVARSLLARLPEELRTLLFPSGSALVAACHDIGKVSPTFYEKLRRACKDVSMVSIPGVDPAMESQWGGHAGVSQKAAEGMSPGDYIPGILGQHHGFSPSLGSYRPNSEVFGGETWQLQRVALVAALKEALQQDWPRIESAAQARVIAGLTSVADWIGSGEFFEDPQQDWRCKIDVALDAAGFVSPRVRHGLSFFDIFGFAPNSIQQQLVSAAVGTGVYVLEAPMGLGKTEAALHVAYTLLDQGLATGIYFALPTQLTSNKIHDRFNTFLQAILEPDCRHRQGLLLHGHAWLLQDTDLGEEGQPGGAWFRQSKRGLLAPFAVGTIDQALMAVMNVKHGFVRAYGLLGKVVILDEVHTYDAYTGTILDALVAFLRQLGCTVIILSATLNRERRQQLLGQAVVQDDYPLISAVADRQALQEVRVEPPPSRQVLLRLRVQDDLAVEEALRRAEQGQQVLWIENTVAEAQQRYQQLAARGDGLRIACGLLHSRFTAHDRQRNEDRWVNLYGKAGWAQRAQGGRILVGTQVLEQSLDIDADFLVSRFAPCDMLFQRLGRVWRHAQTPRFVEAVCEAWLLAPDLESAIADPPRAFGATAAVYSPYVLCRSLEVWSECVSLVLPQAIRPMIEATYVTRQEQGNMVRWLAELGGGVRGRPGLDALKQLARITLAPEGKTLPENQAQTRYSEADTVDVLLVCAMEPCADQQCTRLTLLDGQLLTLPWRRHCLSRVEWRQLSVRLMRQLVSVHPSAAPLPVPRTVLEKLGLHQVFYLGRPEVDEALLRVALVGHSGELGCLQGGRIHERHRLNYRDDLGYRVIKHKD